MTGVTPFQFKILRVPREEISSFSRKFGSRSIGGTITPYDWTGRSCEMRFGRQREAGGTPDFVLSTDEGDIVLGDSGLIAILFRPWRIAASQVGVTYFVDMPMIVAAVDYSFARGQMTFQNGVA